MILNHFQSLADEAAAPDPFMAKLDWAVKQALVPILLKAIPKYSHTCRVTTSYGGVVNSNCSYMVPLGCQLQESSIIDATYNERDYPIENAVFPRLVYIKFPGAQ